MNIKSLFLVFPLIFLPILALLAQPCTNPPGCLSTAQQNVEPAGGATQWYSLWGGAPMTASNNTSPGSSGGSLAMQSLMGGGDRAFTCFDFAPNTRYRVCFKVRNVSGYPGNWFGRVYVYAAQIPNPVGLPTRQLLIDDSYFGPASSAMHMTGVSDWEFVTATFVTNNNSYNSLLIYPMNPQGLPDDGPSQYNPYYKVEIDDIRVETSPSTSVLSISSSVANPLAGCGASTILSIPNLPTGSIANWGPPLYTTGASVTVAPCSTTTYKAKLANDPANNCENCAHEELEYTVVVNQWSDPARIIYPTTQVACTAPLPLQYNAGPGCVGATYEWVEPDGVTSHFGNPMLSPNPPLQANATHTGEWTLRVIPPNGACGEEHKFMIDVGSCCISNPDFNWTTTNPVQFNQTGGGITNHISSVWSFGDGSSSDADNPNHIYNNVPGPQTPFTVCLTTLYEDEQGESCCDRKCYTVLVDPQGQGGCTSVADFTFIPKPWSSTMFDFFDASSGNGTICEYDWDFGDGTIINGTTLPTITHTFATPGPWNVCLTAYTCIYDGSGNLIDKCPDQKCYLVQPAGIMSGNGSRPISKYAHSENDRRALVINRLANQDDAQALSVFPNPNKGNFTIDLKKRKGSYRVIVRDKLSSKVFEREYDFNNTPVKVELGELASGTYSIEVANQTEKFVDQISIVK